MRLLAMGLAALAVAGAARAAPPRMSPPDWLTRPDADALADAYPELAQALAIEGRATIVCEVDLTGRLRDCVAETASPSGLGFDQAALDLSDSIRMRPATIDGRPVDGGSVRIPLRFELPAATAATHDRPAASGPEARRAAQASGIAERMTSGLLDDLAGLSTEGVDPKLAADGLAALHDARRRAGPDVAQAVASAIGSELSPAEIVQWTRYLDGPALRKLLAQGPQMAQAFAAVQTTHTQLVLAQARATFCGRQDCSSDATLGDMRALAAAPESLIDKPRWAQEPSLLEAQAAYPLGAQAFRLSGWAMLQCRVTDVGALEDCQVLAQAPRRLGFGAAGLKVANSYRLHPDLLAQGAAGERVNLPTFFKIEPFDPATPAPPRRSRALNLAREIVRTQGMEAQADRAAALGQALLSHQPGVDEAVRRDAGEAYRGAVIADLPSLLDALAAVYVATLTEPELAELADFLHSRAGRLSTGRDEAFNLKLANALDAIQAKADAEARTAFCATQACGPD